MNATGQTGRELVDELLALESRLLDPAVRRSRETVDLLLAEEFTEFGSSGRIFTKEQILIELSSEPVVSFSISDFKLRFAHHESALVTYLSVRTDETGARHIALRSSFWIHRDARWQMLFHQGTRT